MIAPFPSPVLEWHNDTYASIDPKRPELSAKGKKVVITGEGYGISRDTAIAFAEAGAAAIAILGRKEAPLHETKEFIENKYRISVSTHVTDVADESAVKQAAKEIGEWHVLDMNAGYFSAPAGTLEISAVNLPAPLLVPACSYASSKYALLKVMEVLAAEFPDVHVVTIHPGVIKTNMLEKSGMSVADDFALAELPAHFTVWISSPEAAFVRGKFVSSNWDVDELKKAAKKIAGTDGLLTTGLHYSPELLA
ncbi:putative short chain dehydrogenase [Venturia nashicola]|uniref:Putative short chain dehydrogenase n=1 Tax=Venturia nashicola TaxID=86259 RepID=A0A4Z1P345_9PEZI|nr:putative short chain dehydrogenase [Venturia nashicola]